MDREQLERQQIPVYFVSVILAAAVGLLAPALARPLELLVTPAIAVLMYAMFLQIPFLDLRASLGQRRFIGALLLANFVLVPLLVWAGTRGLTAHPALLAGALLVLLTPCIDYVVVFTHLGQGDSRLTLAATPLLLLLQLALLPLYLLLMLGSASSIEIQVAPFLQAFVLLIALPLGLAVATSAGARRMPRLAAWNQAWAWLPVPAMALVLLAVIGSQVGVVASRLDELLPVLPVYAGFAVLAPLLGLLAARLFSLPAGQARAVTFSAATRNSLVVLPLALALPEPMRTLAAAAVITQTLVELVCELVYMRLVPALIRR